MFQTISCRLCINICNGHRSLYDDDGRRNEVYALTEKYFSPLYLDMECVDLFAVICMECWRHISEFHAFQQSVLLAQKMSLFNKRTETDVKSEEENQQDEEEFITIQPNSMVTTQAQRHNEDHSAEIDNHYLEDFITATTLTFSQDRGNDSCSDNGAHQQSESVGTSEVAGMMNALELNNILAVPMATNVPSGSVVLTKNTASVFSQNQANISCEEESVDSDLELVECNDPVGVFAGGEFDNYKNERTKSERSATFQNSYAVIEPILDNRKEQEPLNTSRWTTTELELHNTLSVSTPTNVPSGNGGLSKNTSSEFSQNQANISCEEESVDSDLELVECNDPVGVFAGGEFDNYENERTKSESSATFQNSYAVIEPILDNRKEQEPLNTSMWTTTGPELHNTLSVSTPTNVPSGSGGLLKNTSSEFSQNQANISCEEESVDSDLELVECDDPVGVFAGGEFDNYENERTKSERSATFQNSHDIIEPNLDNQKVQEPINASMLATLGGNAKSKSEHAIISNHSTEALKRWRRNAHRENLKRHKTGLDFNVSGSYSERPGGVFSSNDEGVEQIKENLSTELDENLKSTDKPKSKRTPYDKMLKRTPYKEIIKRAPPLQEYDDFLVQWRPSFECGICSKSLSSFCLLQQHFDKQHPIEKCHTICCQLKFYGRCEIEKHIRFHMGPNTFKCEQCYESFATKFSLQAHLQVMHAVEPKSEPFQMKDTDNSLTSKQGSNVYTCSVCEKWYKTLGSLQRHTAEVHVGIKCTVCDKVFNNRMTYREHMSSHTGKPMFSCPFCPRTFKSRYTFGDHRRRSHGAEWAEKLKAKAKLKKTYKCSTCDMVYNTREECRKHKTEHVGKPIYICSFCPTTFVLRSGLHLHLEKLHPKEWQEIKEEKAVLEKKIYKCATCGKALETPLAWREHRDTH